MRLYQLLISLPLLAAFGCQTESVDLQSQQAVAAPSIRQPMSVASSPTNWRLKQMVVEGNNSGLGPYYVTTRFTYQQDRLLKQAIYSPISPNPAELTYSYNYDQQGRVSSYLVQYPQPSGDGNTGERHTFSYGDNSFEYKVVRIGADGGGLANQINDARDIYRTNSEGLLTEWLQEGIIRYDRPTRARYVYGYENGNIVKATYLNGNDQEEFTIHYAYDDKVNPFYGWMYTIDPVLRYSRNNVVMTQINTSTPFRTEYTYTEAGLPLTKKDVTKGAVLTYAYETY